MKQQEFDFEAALREKEEGSNRAIAHAERVAPEWKNRCWELCKEWIALFNTGDNISFEKFKFWAVDEKNLPAPPHNSAFSHLPTRAVKAGLIQWNGVTRCQSKKSHAGKIFVWKKI